MRGNDIALILDDDQRELYYLLLDSLTIYANDRLGISNHLLSGDPEMINPFEQAQVAKAIWTGNRNLVDEFADSPDNGLERAEADALRLWKSAVAGLFTAVSQPSGDMLFISDGFAFSVTGIAREMDQVLPQTPVVVEAALVPFEGRIVYGGYVFEQPYDEAPIDAAHIAADVLALFAKGRVVADAGTFMEVAPAIQNARMEQEVSSMMRDLDALVGTAPNDGTHRGALAGLSHEERKRKAHEKAEEAFQASFDLTGLLDSECSRGKPTSKLAECLALSTKAELGQIGLAFGIDLPASMKKDALVEAVASAVSSDDELFSLVVSNAPVAQLDAVRSLCAKGRMEVDASALETLKGLPYPRPPYVYLFKDGASYVFLVPDEVRRLAERADWDEMRAFAQFGDDALEVADALAELRGICTVHEAYDELRLLRPDAAYGSDEFIALLEDAAVDQSRDFDLLNTGEERYVIYYDLSADYIDALKREGTRRGSLGQRAFLHGPLSPVLLDILEARRGKPVRHIDESLFGPDRLLDWELSLPPVVALTRFFDANVPDGKDDLCFADHVVEQVVSMSHGGFAPEDYFSFLKSEGFVPDRVHADEVSEKLKSVAEAIPRWDNNGWSDVELKEIVTGQKTFYNDEGAPMKTGPNDPCPCGSGKKYRDCHGRFIG